jgi:hypothetical protein
MLIHLVVPAMTVRRPQPQWNIYLDVRCCYGTDRLPLKDVAMLIGWTTKGTYMRQQNRSRGTQH